MNHFEKYQFWLKNKYFSKETREELSAISDNEEEIKDRFYKDLEFGTGGLRGKIAMGTNRINIYTISRVTQGLADYLKQKAAKSENAANDLGRGVVIAHDCRHKSREFAETAALVLNANQIKTFLFEDIRPTPELSFTVKYLQAMGGIVITASHNPPEYNGYKVYGPDGGQIIPDVAEEVIFYVNRVKDYSHIKKMNKNVAVKEGLFNIIGKAIDRIYLKKVKELTIRDGDEIDKSIPIVYTPIHGAGNVPVRQILKERGFKNVYVVKEQVNPDPDFSTVESPNPEYPESFELAMKLGKKVDAEILIATDPDSDRIGLAVRNSATSSDELLQKGSKLKEEFIVLSGNQVGVLLVHYILSSKKELGQLPDNGFIVKTIVTSDMSRIIAGNYGIKTYDTLTGFKHICHEARILEEEGLSFLFGYEESIGYVAGHFVRDKDAVISSMLIAEMAAYYQRKGQNLQQVLNELYKKYGYYEDSQHSIYMEGVEGTKKINAIMEIFRKELPVIPDMEVVRIEDYKTGEALMLNEGKSELLNFPRSNVLKSIFADGSWYVLRPSGTEPKIKLYLSFHAASKKEAKRKMKKAEKAILEKINL